ncbi:FG-GAP-like repeat-containing protein [Paenarthrobacter sp. NPDC090517]|uniref:FG-GAP-like repeat-containing protein n=1 Tax=Paenarthrobacter sp. NPDC090517 TaxID=3364381 RepID=UPI0037FF2421
MATAATVLVGIAAAPAKADVVVATVPAGLRPSNLAVNPVTNKIYVPNKDSQTVSVIDGATNQPKVLITRPNPETAVVNSKTNKIYVGHSDGYVTVIDGATNAFTTIQTGGFSEKLLLNEATNRIYIPASTTTVVIDGGNNSMTTIPMLCPAQALALNPTNNKLYINCRIDKIAVLDLTTSRLTALIVGTSDQELTYIDALEVNTVTGKAYAALSSGNYMKPGSISVIDGATDTATAFPVKANPKHIEINSTTNQIFVAHQSSPSAMTRIDGATNTAESFTAGAYPVHTALNEATNKIYVSGSNGSVGVVDAKTMATGIVRNEGGYPGAIAINAKSNKIYISNTERVDVVDGRNVAPRFSSAPPPTTGRVGSYYEHQFAAQGSLTPKFRVSAGTLPAGLSLDVAGLLSGIPTTVGTSSFTVTASNGISPDAVTSTFAVTVKPTEVRHDFTGDRRADVLARDGGGALWLYPGNGYGGWLPRTQVGQGWNVMTSIVAPGDFSGDGNADLLAHDSAGIMWMYPGNGRGGWLARVQVGQGWNGMTAVTAVGDFNLDGNPDILASTSWGYFRVYPGNGTGGWLPPREIDHWWGPATDKYIGPGDFTKDGFQDVISKDAQGSLILRPGYKNSDIQIWNSATIGWGWNAMTAIVGPGDFNGDGNVDLLARDAGGALWLYPSNGQGGWLPRGLVGSGWNAMNLII